MCTSHYMEYRSVIIGTARPNTGDHGFTREENLANLS